MASKFLTLSREDLYELVWSKPLAKLATDFGISGVGLAKRCKKLSVPVPGRGYWARVAVGQQPRRPKLPKRPNAESDSASLTFATPKEEETAPSTVTDQRRESIAQFVVLPTFSLSELHAVTKRTARKLKCDWRKDLVWSRGERTGPTLNIQVQNSSVERALKISDCLIRSAESLGWKFTVAGRSPTTSAVSHNHTNEVDVRIDRHGAFLVEDELISIRIDERSRRIPHVATEAEQRKRRLGEYVYVPNWDYVYLGELRLSICCDERSYLTKIFEDAKVRKIEDRISSVLLSMYDLATTQKQRREDDRIREIERQEAERRRWEHEQAREANLKLVRSLERQAGAWRQAQFLRDYVNSARRALGNKKWEIDLMGRRVDFLDWATDYINQLDPLSSNARDAVFRDESFRYVSNSERLEPLLLRLSGGEWQEALKLLFENSGQNDDMEEVGESNDSAEQ